MVVGGGMRKKCDRGFVFAKLEETNRKEVLRGCVNKSEYDFYI